MPPLEGVNDDLDIPQTTNTGLNSALTSPLATIDRTRKGFEDIHRSANRVASRTSHRGARSVVSPAPRRRRLIATTASHRRAANPYPVLQLSSFDPPRNPAFLGP